MNPSSPNPGDPETISPRAKAARHWALCVLLLLTVILSSLAPVDRLASADYEKLFHRAFITFALARTLNGVISVVQGTELALQPAGVGVTLTPGEILDPVNDLVERFSWIMLGATLSLGIQQVLLEVGQWWGVKALVAAIGLLLIWARVNRGTRAQPGSGTAERVLLRVFIIFLFVRFAVPLAMIANEALFDLFLESRYVESTKVIESAGAEIEQASKAADAEESEDEEGFLDSMQRTFQGTRETLNFGRRLDQIKERASDLIEHLVQLCVVFILQTAILPVAFLWLFLQLLKQLFQGKNRA